MENIDTNARVLPAVRCKCVGSCVGFECTRQRLTALVTSGRFDEAQRMFDIALHDYAADKSLHEQLQTVYEVMLCDNRDVLDRSPSAIPGKPRYAVDAPSVAAEALREPMSCTICLKLLFEPVTTPCGHTFCKACLGRAMDISDSCPMCRTILYLQDAACMPVSNTLRDAIQAVFAGEYETRRKELAADTPTSDTIMSRLPLFPLDTVVFPLQRFPMHIFEARYRLMLRRVMQGSRTFGLVATRRTDDGGTALSAVGSVLEITKIDRFPDGRSVIETIGRDRFRIHGHTTVDEYLVARAELVQDDDRNSAESIDVERRVRATVCALLDRGTQLPAMQNALQRSGKMPSAAQGATALGLWLAGILVSDEEERQRFLEMRNSTTRLNEMSVMLERFDQSCDRRGEGRDCCIQ